MTTLADALDSVGAEAGVEEGRAFLTDGHGRELDGGYVLAGWRVLQTNAGPDVRLEADGLHVQGTKDGKVQWARYDQGDQCWYEEYSTLQEVVDSYASCGRWYDLLDCSDHHVDSDNHDHDQDYCTTFGRQLQEDAKAYDPNAEVFEAVHDNPDYEYAHTTFYVYGKDEKDAVRRLVAACNEDEDGEDDEPEQPRAELVQYGLESNDQNGDGSAVTLYYRGEPTPEQLKEDLVANRGKAVLSCDVDDQFYECVPGDTEVSKLAGLRRYQAHPTV